MPNWIYTLYTLHVSEPKAQIRIASEDRYPHGRVAHTAVVCVAMPSRFVDLGSVEDDTANIAAELASDAAHAMGDAVGDSVRAVTGWAANVTQLHVNASAAARSFVDSATFACGSFASQLSNRDRQTLLECILLLSTASFLLLMRHMVLRVRVQRMVRSHLKLD